MPGREINSKTESDVAFAIVAALGNGTVNGAAINLQRSNSVLFVIENGTITDGSHAVTFEESIDQAFTVPIVLTDDVLRGKTLAELVFDNTNSDIVTQVGVVNSERFLRIVITTSGATLGGQFGATAIRQDLSLTPTT